MFYGDYSILQISGQSFVSDACACLSFVFDVNLRKKQAYIIFIPTFRCICFIIKILLHWLRPKLIQ